MKIKLFFIPIFFLLLPWTAGAAEHQFVDTSEGIVNQLTGSDAFGPSRSFRVVESPSRAITVRLKEKGKELDKEVMVQDDDLTGVARLKVEFDVASARLRPGSYEILDQLGVALGDKRIAGQQVCIKGHTDSDGDDAYNRRLSYQRAESVRAYVANHYNLTEADLFVVGYGEQMPLTDNSSPAGKQMNRRVEITLGCPEVQ